MSDHTQCVENVSASGVQHICEPCPHGLVRGVAWTLTGDRTLDARQRESKLRALDWATCERAARAHARIEAPEGADTEGVQHAGRSSRSSRSSH